MAVSTTRTASNVTILKRLYASISESTSINVVSPIGLALISFGALIVSLLMPPSFYSDVVHEPDLMFLNGHVFLFYSACILSVLAGSSVLRFQPPRFRVLRSAMEDAKPNLRLMIIWPLGVALVIGLITIALILRSNPALIGDVLSGHGAEAKSNLNMKGNLSGMAPFVLAILNYTQVRLFQCERAMSASALRLCRVLWWATFAVAIGTALVKLARYEAVPIILSWLVIFLRTRGSGYSAWYSITRGAAGLAVVLVLFSVFALLRGTEAFQSLMGYGPASFNHLAALLSGRLQLTGQGIYTFTFVDQLPFMHRISDAQFLQYNLLEEFKTEFELTRAAGLNSGLIWVTAYGYYFADWGWGCLIVTTIIGVVTSCAWKSFNFQRAWGSVMYPWLASLTVLAMTSANITRGSLPIVVIMAFALEAWDRLPMWRHNVTAPTRGSFKPHWRRAQKAS